MIKNKNNGDIEGMWWTTDAPEHAVSGRLQLDGTNGINLIIVGKQTKGTPLLSSRFLQKLNRDLIVHGRTTSGRTFTLFSGFPKKSTGSMVAIARTEFVFNYGIEGAIIEDLENLRLCKISARIHGLESWLNTNPFGRKITLNAFHYPSIRLKLPAPLKCIIDSDRTITFEWDSRGPNYAITQTRQVITSRPWVTIQYSSPVTREICLSDLGTFSEYLALQMGFSPFYREVRMFSDQFKEEYNSKQFLRTMTWHANQKRPKESLRKLTPHDLLFTRPRSGRSLRTQLHKWWALRSRHSKVIVPYFSILHTPAPFAEDKFFGYARIAEAVHRHFGVQVKMMPERKWTALRKQITNVIPAKYREKVSSALSYANEMTYNSRLHALLKEFPRLTLDIIGAEDATKAFCRLVTECRHSEAHIRPMKKDVQIDGLDFIRIASKLRVLIDAWLLRELGLRKANIESAMRRNNQYWFYANNTTWPWRVDKV